METAEIIQKELGSLDKGRPHFQFQRLIRRLTDRFIPSEKLVGGLFFVFVGLSFISLSIGRPLGAESLHLSLLYTALWMVWMSIVINIRPGHHRILRSLRNIGPWLAVMLSYDLVRYLIPALHPGQQDEFLRRIETNWGMGDSKWVYLLRGHPQWTDLFSLVYLGLFVWMILYAAYYAMVDERRQQRFMLGFVLIYIGGFLGYLICPATGPRYAYPGEWTWLTGGFFFRICNRTIAGMGAKFDVFPSLHAAISTYLLTWQARFHPRHLVWGIPLLTGIWLSTVFLGFHYAPDLLVGGVLGVVCFWAAPRLKRRMKRPDLRHSKPYIPLTEGGAKPGSNDRSLRVAEYFEKAFYYFSSLLTRFFPRFGVWFFDKVVFPPMGSRFLVERARRGNIRILDGIRSFDRILVVSDMHIGDAIYTQPSISAIRDYFPDSKIDYAVHIKVASLFEGNPEISNVIKVFDGKMLPSRSDLSRLRTLIKDGGYDVIFNFSPFLVKTGAYRKEQSLFDINTFKHVFSRDQLLPDAPNHFLHQVNAFVRSLLRERLEPKREIRPSKVQIYLNGAAFQQAGEWLFNTRWRPPRPLVFLNPDGASPYTRIPEHFQLQILRGLIGQGAFVLLGKGKSDSDIGVRLREGLDITERESTVMIPDWWSLETYASLIDFTDVFISGDTGPLHIAAAWKNIKGAKNGFANRTAVFSIFGATPARMSGYDHFKPGYVPSNQDADSHTFVSESPCRNVTCLNKMMKTCARLRCFEDLDTRVILETADKIFSGKRRWST